MAIFIGSLKSKFLFIRNDLQPTFLIVYFAKCFKLVRCSEIWLKAIDFGLV